MTRTMYDAINALSLPPGGDLYAGYVDGNWPSADAISQRFPHATVVRIATSPSTNDGVVGDGPPDNGSWSQWIGWVQRRRAAGVDPTMYCSLSAWPAGQAAFAGAGVAQPHWWVAHYSPDATIPAGAVALQHTETAGYDISSVADYWPGVDPVPAPISTAAPAAHLEEDPVQIEPLSVHPGEYALIVPSGVTTLVLAADGSELPGATLRVVLWSNDTPTVLSNLTVGGSSGHHVVGHALGGADAVTVRRLDAEAYPVAMGFRA